MEILTVTGKILNELPRPAVQKRTGEPGQPQQVEAQSPPAESATIDLKAVTTEINKFMAEMHYSLQFMVDNKDGQVLIKVLDGDGKLIRQIPPEELVAIAENMGQSAGQVLSKTLK